VSSAPDQPHNHPPRRQDGPRSIRKPHRRCTERPRVAEAAPRRERIQEVIDGRRNPTKPCARYRYHALCWCYYGAPTGSRSSGTNCQPYPRISEARMTMLPPSQRRSARAIELIKFLDLILPTTGHRVLQVKRGSKFLKPQFYSTNADFADAILL
jgi:hypothetical protein